MINGKRERRAFKTKEEADVLAAAKRTERTNQGVAAATLPLDTRADALKASALLAPFQATLEEAARYYVEHVLVYRDSPLIWDVVKQMLNDTKTNGRRPRTIKDLESRLKPLAEDFSNKKISDLTLEDLKEWLRRKENRSPRSRINYITKIAQLYNYAIKHGWADHNLAEQLDRPQVDDKTPGIFLVDQAKKLLRHAPRFHLLPYIALGLFAGLRTTELERLKSDAVRLEDRSIIIGPEVAKKRSRRVVEICDALHAYLKKHPIKTEKIVDLKMFRENMESLRAAAKIREWPHNGLRHSFASYHLAFHGDVVKTAAQMGHRDSEIVHNHYKALVLKSEAETFWGLRP